MMTPGCTLGSTADEQTEIEVRLKEAKLIPRALHAMIGPEGRPRYCGVWGRPPGADIEGQTYRDQLEGSFEQNQADLGDQLLIDVAVSGASQPQPTRERAQAEVQSAEKKLKTKPDDPDARYLRAMAYFRLGENQRSLDDLQFVIRKSPERRLRQTVPGHCPGPARQEARRQVGAGEVPEGRRPGAFQTLPRRCRGGGTGRGAR